MKINIVKKNLLWIIIVILMSGSITVMATPLYDQGNILYKKGRYAQDAQAMDLYSNAAKDGDKEAIFAIATMHYYGEGTKQNYLETKKWLVPNAKNGHAESQALLGLMYHKGQGGNIDLEKATEWLEQSALQCNDTAQFWLSTLLWQQQKEQKNNNVRD